MLFVAWCLEKGHQNGLCVVNMAAPYENACSLTNLSLRQEDFINLKNIAICNAVTTAKHFSLPKEFYCFQSKRGGGGGDETRVENEL